MELLYITRGNRRGNSRQPITKKSRTEYVRLFLYRDIGDIGILDIGYRISGYRISDIGILDIGYRISGISELRRTTTDFVYEVFITMASVDSSNVE